MASTTAVSLQTLIDEARCPRCGATKSLALFSKDKNAKNGRCNWCKSCAGAHSAAWYLKNKDVTNARSKQQYHASGGDRYFRAAYGITAAERHAMWLSQKGLCAMCFRRHPKLQVDHDHATGEIRGLLCPNCNTGLGKIGDTADAIEMARAYVVGR